MTNVIDAVPSIMLVSLAYREGRKDISRAGTSVTGRKKGLRQLDEAHVMNSVLSLVLASSVCKYTQRAAPSATDYLGSRILMAVRYGKAGNWVTAFIRSES